MEIKFETFGIHRQARFGYGPLLGLLLANLLSNSVIAKHDSLAALRLSYESTPWSYNGPNYETQGSYETYNYWHPIKNPYGPPLPPTTAITETSVGQHFHHYHHINAPPNQQQIVNINERPPTEIVIENGESDEMNDQKTFVAGDHPKIPEESSYVHRVNTNIESPHIDEPIAEESNISSVQLTAYTNNNNTDTTLTRKKYVKRGAPSRYRKINKNNRQKHRRYTTTAEYDYESYEDFTTTSRSKPKRKIETRRPIYSNEESNEEYDYDLYDFTTKPYKKRRRTTLKPKRNKNKNKKKQQVVTTTTADYDYEYEKVQPITQIIFRQAQTSTPQSSTIPDTEITNGTTNSTTTTPESITNATNTTGYGYGPSNGNEGISITYGPPHGQPQEGYSPSRPSYGPPKPSYGPPSTAYGHPSTDFEHPNTGYGHPNTAYGSPNGYYQLPFSDWYNSDTTRNAIVKKVNDIVAYDSVFQ